MRRTPERATVPGQLRPATYTARRTLRNGSRGEIPLTAGKDQKLSQEFEDGVLIAREARVPSLLAPLGSWLCKAQHSGLSIPENPAGCPSKRYSAIVESSEL